MRSTESNFRGCKSASGMRIENSFSNALTKSARLKESSRPDSKSESPGAGLIGSAAKLCTMLTILVRLSMGFLVRFRADLLVFLVLPHDIREERIRQAMVPRRREVHVIALSQARVHPVAHGPFAAHPPPRVPKGAAVFA